MTETAKPNRKAGALTDTAVRTAKCRAGAARTRLTDGGGLYLEVSPNDAKRWFWKYVWAGKEKRLALGSYPEVSLKTAREARDEARVQKRAGEDPATQRKLKRMGLLVEGAATFEQVARTWHAARKGNWSPSYAEQVLATLQNHVFPDLGDRPIAQIKPAELLSVLQRRLIKFSKIETADRARTTCSLVWRHAMNLGLVSQDVAASLKEEMPPAPTRHFGAITDPVKLAALLRAMRQYHGSPVVKGALNLLPLVMCRPGELQRAEWSEFDLDRGLWTIPAARMKRRVKGKQDGPPHLVPLSRQAVQILRDLQPITGRSKYVFPSERGADRHISENTLRAALIALGYPGDVMTAHGFRATARTLLDEALNFEPWIIEAQLAHTVKDSLGRAYNRTEYLDQRRKMLQAWADYLDQLAAGGQVVPFAKRSARDEGRA